jgi:hypothetical protein
MARPGRPSPGLDEYVYWHERLANREASGISIDEFCVDEDIARSTFYRWMRRLKNGLPPELEEEKKLSLIDQDPPKFLPVSVTASPVEIELPNGGLVRLPVSVGQEVIVDVIQAITRLQMRRKPKV